MKIRRAFLVFLTVTAFLAAGAISDPAFAQTSAPVSSASPARSGMGIVSSQLQTQDSYPRLSACSLSEPGKNTDLSGVYKVAVRSSEIDFKGKATLTIDKGRFVFAGDSWTRTGRVVATTTCGYTAVALAFEQPNQGATSSKFQVVSVRAVATKSGNRMWFDSVYGEKLDLALTLTTDPDKMFDVHFITDPTTTPVNIMTDLKWRQCKERDKDIKKCPWQAAGDPEKMLGVYRYLVEWSDGRSKNGELEVTSNKTFTITPP